MILNPEAKQKWLEAARSGRYRQTKERLKKFENTQECYCILGILCEVSGVGNWDLEDEDCLKIYAYTDSIDSNIAILTGEVVEWAFSRKEEPRLKDLPKKQEFLNALAEITLDKSNAKFIQNSPGSSFVTEPLTVANDSGASLKALAQIIEEYL